MTTLVITHAVAEYDAWKQVFDEHAASRREHGCLSEELFRVAGRGRHDHERHALSKPAGHCGRP